MLRIVGSEKLDAAGHTAGDENIPFRVFICGGSFPGGRQFALVEIHSTGFPFKLHINTRRQQRGEQNDNNKFPHGLYPFLLMLIDMVADRSSRQSNWLQFDVSGVFVQDKVGLQQGFPILIPDSENFVLVLADICFANL